MTQTDLEQKKLELEKQKEQLERNLIAISGALQLISQLITEEATSGNSKNSDQD